MSILATIASDSTLDAAFEWLRQRRKAYPASADVWDFRRRWPKEKHRIQADLLAGTYPAFKIERTLGKNILMFLFIVK